MEDCCLEPPCRKYVPEQKGKMFKELLNVVGIADNIFTVGPNEIGADHNKTVCKILQICRKEILKPKKINAS